MKKVLFVCTGNTCRSSMAEAIAKKLLEEKQRNGEMLFSSAGIYAVTGSNASDQAIEALKDFGIDLKSHSARRVNEEIINEADIILTMTKGHKEQLLAMMPEASGKVYTLAEYAGYGSKDIEDPFGRPVNTYRACAAEIREYIEKAVDKMIS